MHDSPRRWRQEKLGQANWLLLARTRLRSSRHSQDAFTGVHGSPHAASQNGMSSDTGQFLRHKTLALLGASKPRPPTPSKGPDSKHRGSHTDCRHSWDRFYRGLPRCPQDQGLATKN